MATSVGIRSLILYSRGLGKVSQRLGSIPQLRISLIIPYDI